MISIRISFSKSLFAPYLILAISQDGAVLSERPDPFEAVLQAAPQQVPRDPKRPAGHHARPCQCTHAGKGKEV